MEAYIDAISFEVKELMQNWSPYMKTQARYELDEWINEREKHSVTDYFDRPENGIYYTKCLYESRVRCFYEILMKTDVNPIILKIMKKSSSIVSFGCGPGPEIAACISFLRKTLLCTKHNLNITAVDCLGHWRTFVEVIKQLDHNVKIKFQNERVSLNYLQTMDYSDICIMSYPHAMNFEYIWGDLIRKFTLVIFIDQPKRRIRQIMITHGFTKVDFQFKGEKSFFYHINKYRDCSVNSKICKEIIQVPFACGHLNRIYCYQEEMNLSQLKCQTTISRTCKRGWHQHRSICSETLICEEMIDLDLKCGHTTLMRCCDNETSQRMSKVCNFKTTERCKRNLHYITVVCGSLARCSNSVDVERKCGHSISIKCYENEYNVFAETSCLKTVTEVCDRGKHQESRSCYSAPHCTESISIKLRCGHNSTLKCWEDESRKRYLIKCNFVCIVKCPRLLHDVSFVCGSSNACEQIIKLTRKCGHITTVKCCVNDNYVIREERCLQKFTVMCKAGAHKHEVICASYLESKKEILCKNIIDVKKYCGHVVSIKCFEDESSVDKGSCSIAMKRRCDRKLHVSMAPCSNKAACTEMLEYKLPCSHFRTMKCFEDELSVTNARKCEIEMTIKCKRNIHKLTKQCWEEAHCTFKYSLKLACKCRKIVTCDTFENESGHFVCRGDCYTAVRQRYKSEMNEPNPGEERRPLCGHLSTELVCKESCNHTLRCGHKCQWSCDLCLGGRLHRICLEKCNRKLSCGHRCVDNCHAGNCDTCPDDCLYSKLRNVFVFKHKMPLSQQSMWISLFKPWIKKGPDEMKELFEIISFDIHENQFSDETLKKFQTLFKLFKSVLDFYESFITDKISLNLTECINTVHVSMVALVKWLMTENFGKNEFSFDDFDMEFQRIKDYISICRLFNLGHQCLMEEDSKPFHELLDLLTTCKYNANLREELFSRANTILM